MSTLYDQIHENLTERTAIAALSTASDNELHEACMRLADDGFAAELIIALTAKIADRPNLERTILAILDAVTDALSMAEIASVITSGFQIPSADQFHTMLLKKAQDSELDFGTRAHALRAVLYLSQDGGQRLRRLKSYLLMISAQDDPEYLARAVAIIGIVASQTLDDELRQLLAEITSVPEAKSNAAQYLGELALAHALGSHDSATVVTELRAAADWFSKSMAWTETNPAAELYRACIDILLKFQIQQGQAGDDLGEQVKVVEAAVFEYLAVNSVHDGRPVDQSWLGSRLVAVTHWASMARTLGALDLSLAKEAWTQAVEVIERELLVIWTASRTIFSRKTDGGIERITRPRIASSIQQRSAQLSVLRQWILENEGSPWLLDAEALQAQATVELERTLLRQNPTDAVATGQTATAILERSAIPANYRVAVRSRLDQAARVLDVEDTEPIILDIAEKLEEQLRKNSDYKVDKRAALFMATLFQTLRFVRDRHNMQKDAVPLAAYLFKHGDTPHEEDMQTDYFNYLRSQALGSITSQEVRDRAAGRCDIEFSFDGIAFVAELKRTTEDKTLGELLQLYGLQQISYQSANVRFGILMVLDLHDRGGGPGDIREQAEVHYMTPPWATSEYAVVVIRVQGRRRVPSKLNP